MSALSYTVLTSTRPPRLSKVLGINADGTLRRTSAASMVSGTAERVQVADLNELAAALEALTPAQAVAWGVAQAKHARILTQEAQTGDSTAIARDCAHFRFLKAPGVMMLDHDGGPHGEGLRG